MELHFSYNYYSINNQTRMMVMKLQFQIKIKYYRVLCSRNNKIIINYIISIIV